MAQLSLALACGDYDRTRPLADGRVQAQGIDLNCLFMQPRQAFARMLQHREFHVSEMSLSTYATLRAKGDTSLIAIPVALSRIFRHDCIYVRTDAGIEKPEDLKGRRVGINQYTITAAVFMKGMLMDDYGVLPEDVEWLTGGLDAPLAQPPILPALPEKVRLEVIPAGKTLSEMLEDGELDALLAHNIPACFQHGSPWVRRLFPNFKEVEADYYRRTGIFPIMHTVVIREEVYREHPWVAPSLYQAFKQAKDIALDGLYDTDALKLTLPFLIDHVEEARRVFGPAFWPYGVEPNRPTLEALTRYLVEQGLAPRQVPAEELFAPNTR